MGKKVTKEKGEKRAKAKGGAKGDFWSLSTESGNYVILFVKERTTKLGKADAERMIKFFSDHDDFTSPNSDLRVLIIDSHSVGGGECISQPAIDELTSNAVSVYKIA